MAILRIRKPDGSFEEVPALVGSSGKSAYAYAVEKGYTGTEEQFAKILAGLKGAPAKVDLSALGPDDTGKGYITEVFGEGEDAPTKVTEVVYDDAGNIIKIGNTAINWGEEG